MNTAGIRGHHGDLAREIDGWTYLDMYADDNATLAGLLRRTDLPEGGPFQLAKGYDLGRLVAEGIAADRSCRPRGCGRSRACEWLPAAQGHNGTLLGFGNHDRGALHGRYLVNAAMGRRHLRAGLTSLPCREPRAVARLMRVAVPLTARSFVGGRSRA